MFTETIDWSEICQARHRKISKGLIEASIESRVKLKLWPGRVARSRRDKWLRPCILPHFALARGLKASLLYVHFSEARAQWLTRRTRHAGIRSGQICPVIIMLKLWIIWPQVALLLCDISALRCAYVYIRICTRGDNNWRSFVWVTFRRDDFQPFQVHAALYHVDHSCATSCRSLT